MTAVLLPYCSAKRSRIAPLTFDKRKSTREADVWLCQAVALVRAPGSQPGNWKFESFHEHQNGVHDERNRRADVLFEHPALRDDSHIVGARR